MTCDECAIEKAAIEHSIIGIRSLVGEGTVLKNVIPYADPFTGEADAMVFKGRTRAEPVTRPAFAISPFLERVIRFRAERAGREREKQK